MVIVTKPQQDVPVLDSDLVTKAVSALAHYYEKNKPANDLLESPAPVHVQIGLQNAPTRKFAKPFQIPVPHSIHRQEEADICLFVKQSDVKELTKIYQDTKLVKKVMGLDTLRSDYGEYSQRRRLMKTYAVFLADDRIATMVPDALGREAWKRPALPVRVFNAHSIRKAVYGSTFMSVARGTCILIKAGDMSLDVHDVVENVCAIFESALQQLGARGMRMQAVSVKLSTSAALPIWNMLPTEFVEKKEEIVEEEEEVVKMEEDEKVEKKPTKSPLLNALKKQKEEGGGSDRKRKNKNEATENEEEDAIEKADKPKKKKKSKKDKQSKDLKDDLAADQVKQESTKKNKTRQAEQKEEAQELVPEKECKSEKKSKKSKKSKEPEDVAKESKVAEPKAFMAAKKYRGSKEGYVFKHADSGLGYYIDVKPVVDRMVIEALTRSNSNKKKSPGNKQGKGRSKSNGRSRRR